MLLSGIGHLWWRCFMWYSWLYCINMCLLNVFLKAYYLKLNDYFSVCVWYVLEGWNVHLHDTMSNWRICSMFMIKHASVWNVMKESISMSRDQCNKNGYCMKCVFTHTYLNNWLMIMNENGEGLGWTLFVSWDELFCSNLTISQDLYNVGWRVYNIRDLRCGVQ